MSDARFEYSSIRHKSMFEILTENIFYEIDKRVERQYVKGLIEVSTVKDIIKNEMKLPIKEKILEADND